jgi:hypothetical protein
MVAQSIFRISAVICSSFVLARITLVTYAALVSWIKSV